MMILLTSTHHSSAGFLGAVADHHAAKAILRRRGAVDLELGETLLALFEGDRLLRLGYAKPGDYARERLGLAPRTVRQFTRLARGLADRLILRRAVVEGRVSMRKALLVMDAAVGDEETAWTDAAAQMTEKRLRERLEAGGRFVPDEEFVVETVLVRMEPRQQDRLDDALGMANVACGTVVAKWKALEAVAMEWASGHGESWPEGSDPRTGSDPMGRVSTGPWRMKPLLESSWTDTAEPMPTDPLELDERARALAAERLDFDLEFGPLLARIQRHRVWWEFRCGSWEEYVTEWLGLSVRTVRQKLWLERRMMELPEIRAALRSRRLTWTKALFVAREATPEDVAERIALTASTTLEQTERESDDSERRQNRAAGVRRLWGPEDAFETISMAIGSCQQWFRERGEVISVGEALARMADHFSSVWREEVEREKKRTSKKRREVLLRNRGFCAFPGCTRPAEHDHHVKYKSQGGSDEVWNRLGLCVAHHLRVVHRGLATVRGVAGERLVWEFGSGERFVTVGDDRVCVTA